MYRVQYIVDGIWIIPVYVHTRRFNKVNGPISSHEMISNACLDSFDKFNIENEQKGNFNHTKRS